MAEYLATLSLLIIIVLLVRGFFRKSISPTVMYALWLVVVLRLCLPFPLFRVEMDLPAWQETIPQEQQGQQEATDSGIDPDTVTPPVADLPSVPDTPPVIIPTTPSIPSVPSVPTVPSVPENPAVPGENPMPDVPVTPEVPVTPPAPIDWMRVAVAVWIAGSAILALWFAITGIVYHYRLITHRTLYKTLRKTKVYLTEDESAPCLAGVIPAIYIPPVEMDEDFRAFIVLHEYMHLRHGDHVWAVVRILALIAHWWNPLVWAAVILSKRDAELACDHAVAAQLNRENRLEYARVLLDTIPQKHRYAVGLGSAPMKERILRLTKTQKNRILCVVLAVIIAAAAVVCSFIGLKDREEEQGVGYDNVGDLIKLLNTTAAELTDRYGEMTLEYMENGGTPVYSCANLPGILFVFPVSDTLPTDGQIPDEILLTSEYSKDVYGIQVGMNLTEVSDDISWDDAWFSLNQGAAGVRKDYPNCILTLTVACQAGTTPNEENSSAEWETWREEFIKNPAGEVTQIRVKLPPAADPAISARAEKLTAHLIQYVMIEDWLEKSYTITAQDVFAFFDSLRWYTYKDLSEYPYGDKVEIVTVGDHSYAQLLLIDAERMAYEVFGWNNWDVDVFPNDDYDASKQTYLFRLEPGLWAAGFTCENMTVSVQGDHVHVRCTLADYGQYEFHYRYTEENGGYLTLINGEYLSAPDIPLPDNFAEFYYEAERVYALFTGYRANIYTEGKFSDDGADYQAVDIGGCTTMAGLRALCEQYFDAALTDELLSTTVMNQYPLYREHNGKLYRFSGYVAQFGYDIGKSYRMSAVKTENGAQTARVSAVWYEGERQISTEVSCAYTTLENGDIRFTSFSLMAQALSNAWANYSDYMLLTQSDYNGISLYYRSDDHDESMAENFLIRFGGREAYISTTPSAWLRDTWEPQLYCIDMELPGMPKDGIEDAIVILTTGTGTGVHIEEAYVLSGADGTLHSFTEPYTVIENAASRDDNGKTWIADASGKQIGFPDNAYFDEHFKFYIEDGCLGAKVSIGYGMLQYLESYFRVKYGESGVSWEYVYGDTAPATVSLHDYKNKKLVNSLVYEGYTVQYELPHPTYEGQTFDFHIHLPQIDDDSPSAEKWNTDIVNAYDAKYSSYLSGSASGTNRNFYAEIRYETVTTGDVVTIYILNSCGVLNSGDARRSYDIYHYDTKGKRFLTTNEFLAYYAKGQFASSVADIVAFMNEHAFNTDEAGTPIPLKEENIQGVIPSVFGGGKFDVVYQGYNMEGKFATRTLFSPYPTYGNPHRYTYRLTYHDYTDCHTAEMNGRPAGYRLLLSQRVEGQYDAGYYVDCLFTEDIAERPESYPQSVYGEYYTPVRDDAYGNMYIVTDHKTDRGQLQAWIPFDQPSAAQDYYRGVLLGYFNYDRLFGGNYTVEKSVGGMIADVLDAYRNGKDPNEHLPASETTFTPYPAKTVRANPGDKEIRAILDAATVDEEGIIRLRVDLGEGYILELPMDLGIFGESYQAYFTGIYFVKVQKVTTQGPFVGYVADKTTPWIDLYTEKNGTYVGRIPYEIFHDWIATDRDKDTWKSGWMGEYVCFYYAEFGDFRWGAAHLRDTVLGSGRKNVATSADGGKTWDIGSTRDNYGGNHVVGMGFATDKIAFISYDPYNEHDGADGPVISRTTDGGKTWKLLEISLPDSLGGQKLISGIPFYDGDLLRYPVWLNPSHGTKEGEVMYLISRDKGMTWKWEKDSTSGTASLSGVLSCILRGEDAFHDTATKQRAYLTDWLKTNEMSVSKYSVIDLNGDGAPELVLWLNRGTNEYVGFLVLYNKNTTVYAHLLYYREFCDLKEDGTFDFSSGVSNHGIGRIDFEGDTYTIRKLAYCESADNQNVSYFLENKSVTKPAFDAYENAQNSKPDAVWVEHSIEAAPGYKQYTPAIEIDTANREYIMPMAMYGESQPGANFDRTANIHPGTGSEGYADGVGYITFGVCSDWKSSDYVSRYYTYRVTSAGGYIISVEEAETITRDMVLKKGKPYTGSLEGQHVCVVNNRYYGITISGDTISASVGLYQTDAGGTGKGTYTYDPKTGKMSITTIEKYHDGNGNLLVDSPKTVTGKLYEYNDMVHFLYDDAKATPLPLSFPKVNAFPPDRTDFIFDDLAGGWYHSFRDEKGDQFYCLALDPETQQIRFDHGFYDGSYAARYVGTYRVDYNYIIHATLRDNNDPDGGEMQFVFILEYSHGRDETGVMRTTISITPQSCDMENYRDMLGRIFHFTRNKATTEELKEREEQYNFVMSAYEKAAEAAVMFYTAGSVDTSDSVWVDGETYFRVEGFDTPNDLRLYMESHFDPALIDRFLTGKDAAKYIHHEGKLYSIPSTLPENSRLGERYYAVSKVKDDRYILNVTVEVLDTKDLTTVLAYQSFQFDYQYKNGKWVFTGFPHIQ